MRFSLGTVSLLNALVFAVSKPVLPRTLWERRAKADESRKLQNTTSSGSSIDLLRNVLNVNAGTAASFQAVTDSLVQAAAFQNVTSAGFEKMFNTFKILQDAPAYQAAVASNANLTDPTTQVEVLSKSVSQFMNLAVNLFTAMDKNSGSNMNERMVSYFNDSSSNVTDAVSAVTNGNSTAMQALQQGFVDANFPGINLERIQDDDFVKASRQMLANDTGLQNLMNNDQQTLGVLLDEDLLFANSPLNAANQG